MAEETKKPIKKVEEKKVETKPVEAKPVETKPVETKKEEAKEEAKPEVKEEAKPEAKVEEKKEETKSETKEEAKPEVKEESKSEVKEESKSKSKKETIKPKDKAIANGFSLQISPKHTKAICKMIKGKTLPQALIFLENVVKGKQAVKMTGLEVPHQKGKGIAGARFPKNASKAILGVVKQLGANATVNGIEEPIITMAMPNQASAPLRKGGRKAKRTHLRLEAQDKTKLIKENPSKKSKKGDKK